MLASDRCEETSSKQSRKGRRPDDKLKGGGRKWAQQMSKDAFAACKALGHPCEG
jgi:hypothetical protein